MDNTGKIEDTELLNAVGDGGDGGDVRGGLGVLGTHDLRHGLRQMD